LNILKDSSGVDQYKMRKITVSRDCKNLLVGLLHLNSLLSLTINIYFFVRLFFHSGKSVIALLSISKQF